MDPAGGQRSDQTGSSTIALLRQAGYRVRAARRGLIEGLEAIRRRLEPDADGPRLIVHPRCESLIESLTCYHFDPDKPWRDDPVKDGHDHHADALRYLTVSLDAPSGKVQVRGY